MRQVLALARREYAGMFRVPTGWIVMALFLLFSGMAFLGSGLVPGAPASMRSVFEVMGWVLLPVAPAVSMRLFSEEARTGTMESLLACPASDGVIVAGKYLGAFAFLVTMLVPTLLHVAVLDGVATEGIDFGPIVSGYVSVMLLGGLYLALGTLTSVMTSNQTLAFVASLLVILLLLLAPLAGPALPSWAEGLVVSVSPSSRLGDFARGVVSFEDVVVLGSGTVWLLVLAALTFRAKRRR